MILHSRDRYSSHLRHVPSPALTLCPLRREFDDDFPLKRGQSLFSVYFRISDHAYNAAIELRTTGGLTASMPSQSSLLCSTMEFPQYLSSANNHPCRHQCQQHLLTVGCESWLQIATLTDRRVKTQGNDSDTKLSAPLVVSAVPAGPIFLGLCWA